MTAGLRNSWMQEQRRVQEQDGQQLDGYYGLTSVASESSPVREGQI